MTGLIATEWIEPRGGAEKVLDALAELYPDAEIITPWNDAPHRFPGRVINELRLSKTPIRGRKALAVPALAAAWRTALPRDAEYDWIIASSHLFAHHIRHGRDATGIPKLVYAHTPARYLWAPELDTRGASLPARALASALRPLDRRRAGEATAIAANSRFVQERIQRTWQREATVIYPPVEIELLRSVGDWRTTLTRDELRIVEALPSDFALGASRFVAYKKLDLVMKASEHVGIPVVIAGGGPERAHLEALAQELKVPVTFVPTPSDNLLHALYQLARVFVFPPIEDFGIMPVEAIALGTPVVSSAVGGTAETVVEGISGYHFESAAVAEVGHALRAALDLATADPHAVDSFSRASFDREFSAWMSAAIDGLTRPTTIP
jgi:glycosyltransferase involved in cell wall biosynthesis